MNEEAAVALAKEFGDEAVARLILEILAATKLSLLRRADETTAEWRRRLPAAPLDFLFIARVLTLAMPNRRVVEALLDGPGDPYAL